MDEFRVESENTIVESRVERGEISKRFAIPSPFSHSPTPHNAVSICKRYVYTLTLENDWLLRISLSNGFTLNNVDWTEFCPVYIFSRVYSDCACVFFFFLKSNNGRFRSNNLFISLRSDRSDLEPSVQDPTHLISRAREPNSSLFFLSSLSLFLSLSLPFLSNAKPRTKISIQDPSSFLTGVSRTEIT